VFKSIGLKSLNNENRMNIVRWSPSRTKGKRFLERLEIRSITQFCYKVNNNLRQVKWSLLSSGCFSQRVLRDLLDFQFVQLSNRVSLSSLLDLDGMFTLMWNECQMKSSSAYISTYTHILVCTLLMHVLLTPASR